MIAREHEDESSLPLKIELELIASVANKQKAAICRQIFHESARMNPRFPLKLKLEIDRIRRDLRPTS